MFHDAIDALGEALETAVGELVTYTCAATSATVELTAVRGRSLINVQSTDGAILQVWSNDFIASARALWPLNNNQPYTPVKGDTITINHQPIAGLAWSETYELMTPSFTPSDHAGKRLRLHTVRTT